MKKKVVYVGLSADILHEGHMNILKFASRLGKVVVGLLTDEAISTYKKIPILKYRNLLHDNFSSKSSTNRLKMLFGIDYPSKEP